MRERMKRRAMLAGGLAGLLVAFGALGETEGGRQVVAYYFHGTVRCESCLAIEKRAGEVVTNRFGAEIALGRLTFRSLNYDQPENAHYLKDYKLPCPSLVLVRQKNGEDQERKLLGQTWEMVQIPPKLDAYIEEELAQFLAGTNSAAGGGGATNGAAAPAALGTNITALAELSTRAAEMNAVMVFLPAKGQEPTAAALGAIRGAKEELEARFTIRIGLFTMAPGSADYEKMAAEMAVPGVVPIVKTGAKRYVSGELTQEKIVEGFMAAVAAAGCCPLGYPRERR